MRLEVVEPVHLQRQLQNPAIQRGLESFYRNVGMYKYR